MTAEEHETIFRRWLSDHVGLILKVVRASFVSPADQDDLFQDILLQLWISVPAFRGEAKETTWIYRVAFNTMLVWRRGEFRRRKGHENFLKLDVSPQIQPSHTESAATVEIVNALYGAIRKLPKVDASLALLHLDGLSYREMAEVLGISENHVGVKLNRIRKQLAEDLEGVVHEL